MPEQKRDQPDHELPDRERADPADRRDWETLQQNESDSTDRLKIAGGWLYRTTTPVGTAMVFIPDRA